MYLVIKNMCALFQKHMCTLHFLVNFVRTYEYPSRTYVYAAFSHQIHWNICARLPKHMCTLYIGHVYIFNKDVQYLKLQNNCYLYFLWEATSKHIHNLKHLSLILIQLQNTYAQTKTYMRKLKHICKYYFFNVISKLKHICTPILLFIQVTKHICTIFLYI